MFFRFFNGVAFNVRRDLFTCPFNESFILMNIARFSVVPRGVIRASFGTQCTYRVCFPYLCLRGVVFAQVDSYARLIGLNIRTYHGRTTPIRREEQVIISLFFCPIASRNANVRLFTSATGTQLVTYHADLLSQLSNAGNSFRLCRFTKESTASHCFKGGAFRVASLFRLLFRRFFRFKVTRGVFRCILTLVSQFRVLRERRCPATRRAQSRQKGNLIRRVRRTHPLLIRHTSRLRTTRHGLVRTRVTVFFSAKGENSVQGVNILHLVRVVRSNPQDCSSRFRVLSARAFRILHFRVFRGPIINDFQDGRPIVRFGGGRPEARDLFGAFATAPFSRCFFQ